MNSTPTPPKLWKYRPWNDFTRRLIVDGEFHFAKTTELNDPFEFRWRDRLPTSQIDIENYAKELCALEFPLDSVEERRARYCRLVAELHAIAQTRKNGIGPKHGVVKLGVFCFTEANDDILMWSHYADQHRGVCVSFDLDKLKSKLVRKVSYECELPLVDGWDYLSTKKRDVYVELSLKKSRHWAYEREWRTVDRAGQRLFPGAVDSIVVGALASDATWNAVKEAAESAGRQIEIRRAVLSDARYAVDIIDGCS